MAERNPSYRVVLGTEELLQTYGGVAAVPKLFIFDANGRRSQVFYGAPPDLHEQVTQALKKAGL